jgi:membrane protease YdiL (CAAX protease family)
MPDREPPPREVGAALCFLGVVALTLQVVLLGCLIFVVDGALAQFFATSAGIAGVGGMLVVAARRLTLGRPQLGLDWRYLPSASLLGLLVYVAALPAVIWIHWVNAERLPDPEVVQDSMRIYLDEVRAGNLFTVVVISVGLIVVVPLFEELVFRGFIQGGLRALLSKGLGDAGAGAAAVLFASVLFTVVHPPFTWLPIFGLSLLLGTLFERSRSLWAGVSLHAAHNAYTLVTGVLLTV